MLIETKAENSSPYFLLLLIFLTSLHLNGAYDEYVPFEQNYAPLWAPENIRILDQSREVQLDLDQRSGSGFQSLQKFGSGWFNMRIKMPQKDSTAVITTFYDRPYLLNTNIFTKGQGGREQRIFLWFEARYLEFGLDACQNQNTSDQQVGHSSELWWNAKKYQTLSPFQKQAYDNMRSKYLNYDYCTKMFHSPECQDRTVNKCVK
ncbi:putative xyloglucan endotransglucosylase/hydrolase protein 1 [Glycine soja]